MQAWIYEVHDVLLIKLHGEEKVVRITRFVDSLDNTKPLYGNLRVAEGKRWSAGVIKIQPDQIIRPLPNWYEEKGNKKMDAKTWRKDASAGRTSEIVGPAWARPIH